MDRQQMYLNPDHIVSIEETPDTVITLFNGHHFIIKESADSIIGKIVSFRARIIRRASKRSGDKKYLDRSVRGSYRSMTLNREITCPEDVYKHERSPLHTRDI